MIFEAVQEYMLDFIRDDNEYDTLQGLALLFAIKNNYQEVVERLLRDGPDSDSKSSSPGTDPSSSVWQAAVQLTARPTQINRSNELPDNTALFF